MAKYLDKSGVTYLWNKIKGLFTDQSLNTKNKTYAGAINEINTKVGNLTGAFLWKGKFDTLPAVTNYEAGNVVGIGKKEYVLTVTEGTKTWEEFGDEGSYLLKTAAEETYLKKTAGEVKTANLADNAVTENKLNDDLRSKVNDNVKTITQTLTDTQKAQARQNIDVLEVTQQDIDNLPGGGLDPISDNTIPEVKGIETLLGFDVNGNISKTKTIDTKHLATGSVTKEKLDSKLQNSIGTKAIRINYGDVEAAKAALEEYNADPNKTVILVNYKSVRVPASVSGTFIVALVTEGNNERKLLYKNGEWNDSVIFNHSSVLYTAQTITDKQKQTARENIGINGVDESTQFSYVVRDYYGRIRITDGVVADQAATKGQLDSIVLHTYSFTSFAEFFDSLAKGESKVYNSSQYSEKPDAGFVIEDGKGVVMWIPRQNSVTGPTYFATCPDTNGNIVELRIENSKLTITKPN